MVTFELPDIDKAEAVENLDRFRAYGYDIPVHQREKLMEEIEREERQHRRDYRTRGR